MAPYFSPEPRRSPEPHRSASQAATPMARLAFNADLAAIGIALLLAGLVRWNVVPHIGW